jgi:hypothetical protein
MLLSSRIFASHILLELDTVWLTPLRITAQLAGGQWKSYLWTIMIRVGNYLNSPCSSYHRYPETGGTNRGVRPSL